MCARWKVTVYAGASRPAYRLFDRYEAANEYWTLMSFKGFSCTLGEV